MKKKSFEAIVYSAVGVIAMFVILVAINFIAAQFKQRIDLTAEKAYTLSAGTKAILAKLDTPVQIRFYVSQRATEMPVALKTYAQRVDDLLWEYQQASRGLIEIQKLDPEPDSDAEDSARLDGIQGQLLPGGERIYLGLSVTMLDQKQAIPFLAPDRERLLEYDISRAIARVSETHKPTIGVMSSLPVMGMPMMPMAQQEGSQPWAFITELQRDFNVEQVEVTADKIPDDIQVLVVIHPKGISDVTQYAIDQFVLRGGRLLAFLDPRDMLDRMGQGMGAQASTSNLDKLLRAWGLTFETSKVVADMNYFARTRQGRAPAILLLTEKAMNKDDIVTANADNIVMAMTGSFSGTPAKGLKETVLIKSSPDSELIDGMMAQFGGESIATNFNPSGKEYPLAVRLSGEFKTAFPKGRPKAAKPAPEEDKSQPNEQKTNKEEDKGGPWLKESTKETSVVLVGDADMIQDPLAIRAMQNPFGGQRLIMPANGNLAFAQGIVEQLSGDSNLIALRSRASRERPFTVVKKIQADAEANYRTKIKELETSLSETQRKVNELQKGKETGQKFILSPEQQQELANFQKKEVEVKTELRSVRKQLRAEIDSLETRIKWLNIAAVPALVALTGLGLALVRRRRAAS
jgi:gliding motility-associatede transport system auxiliary component